jgi:hypothetical protein
MAGLGWALLSPRHVAAAPPTSESKPPATAQPFDASFITPDYAGAIVIQPQRLLKSPLVPGRHRAT